MTCSRVEDRIDRDGDEPRSIMRSQASRMNMSQKRYFTLLQMLESMQTSISDMQAVIRETAEISLETNKVAFAANARLLLAGQALLGKKSHGFSKEFQEEFKFGITLPD
jgi:hypothetical protein